jgi:hypothetical protein
MLSGMAAVFLLEATAREVSDKRQCVEDSNAEHLRGY